MAVERVIATIAGTESQLNNIANDKYSGRVSTPKVPGEYSLDIYAYDDAGNISVASADTNPALSIEVLLWHTPKTNWTVKDRFNFIDYNRIKDNLVYLQEYAAQIIKSFQINDMGADIEDYKTLWDVDTFNAIEQNLETINKNLFAKDYGATQTFYENGIFIKWDELNRIEGTILSIKKELDNYKAALNRLSFRLGNFKGVAT